MINDPLEEYIDYIEARIKDAVVNGGTVIIDFKKDNLETYLFSRGLWEEFIENPVTFIGRLKRIIEDRVKMYDDEIKVKVILKNFPEFLRKTITEIKDLDKVGRLVVFEGVVRKVSSVVPMITRVQYVCEDCGSLIDVIPVKGRIPRIHHCEECRSRRIRYYSEEKRLGQIIEVQEYLGRTRRTDYIKVFLYDELTNTVDLGDKIVIAGILREVRESNRVYGDFIVEAINIEFVEEDLKNIDITAEDIQKIKELAKDPEIYSKLAKSIASSIYGYETIKLAIALQLFGGVEKIEPDGTKKRGNIHILLVGDPSTAKSQILRAVARVAPRAVLVDATKMSKAGLSATVTWDDTAGRWTVEAGALILADQGMLVIDELEKADRKDLQVLNEALEQQTVTINKAGISGTLNARCTVLASANPKRGRFDRHEPIVEQINLDPSLLSRFDLIFVILDEPDEKRDTVIMRYARSSSEDKEPPIPPELLRKYVYYARNSVKDVKIPKKVEDKLIEFYVSLRKQSKEARSYCYYRKAG
jgi:replicative DNA helicase Mcm